MGLVSRFPLCGFIRLEHAAQPAIRDVDTTPSDVGSHGVRWKARRGKLFANCSADPQKSSFAQPKPRSVSRLNVFAEKQDSLSLLR
jgi:hypothetical protein